MPSGHSASSEKGVISEKSAIPQAPTTYDAIPYQSAAFEQTHPNRLATMARVFGLTPPDIAACRVLELGCASGGNLIPMAFELPGSEFVGIDLSQRQVDEGRRIVDTLGLSNIRIEQASILDIDQSWGLFDYVICHGVFSWVEALVQDKILQVAGSNLAPDGVAFVSYNTYPGWHMRQMVREMMRYHAGQFAEPSEQIAQARALLAFLASASQSSGAYGELLAGEVDRLSRAADSYVFHEHLEQTNTPLYFHQFAERAAAAGLLYLSEASVSHMLTSHLPPPVAATLERISPDLLHLEQYMDFVRNRTFRQTLLVHSHQRPARTLAPSCMDGLMVSSDATPETTPLDLRSNDAVSFANGSQRASVSSIATKAALSILAERWPEAIGIGDLCEHALERAAPHLRGTADEARTEIVGDVFGCVMYGMVGLHTRPPHCTSQPSDTPRAHPLSAHQARFDTKVVNAHHHMVDLQRLGAEVLRLCDGTRRLSDIANVLMAGFERGDIVLEDEGKPVTAPEPARRLLAERLQMTLATLTRSAVLVG